MMKKLALLLILLTFQANAQFWFNKENIKGNGQVITEKRTIGNFSGIKITGAYKVKIVEGTEGKIMLTTDENLLPVIETYVDGDELVIKTNKKFNIKRYTELSITIPVEDISKIKITGSAAVRGMQKFHWKNLDLYVTGSGSIKLDIDNNELSAYVTGSGNIELTGKTQFVEEYVTGSGTINSEKLQAEKVKAYVTGSGDIYLYVKTRLKANVTGSGDIFYTGDPEFLKTKVLGSGRIQKR